VMVARRAPNAGGRFVNVGSSDIVVVGARFAVKRVAMPSLSFSSHRAC